MSLFQRLWEGIRGAKPIDDMANAFPKEAFNVAEGLSAYPKKTSLADRGVFAYRLEFMVSTSDAEPVARAIAAEFNLQNQEIFQKGEVRSQGKALYFSIEPEFGGAVISIATNSIGLLAKIDALNLEPPPPWEVFPDEDPATLGSLQGSIDYWWSRLFFPFWNASDADNRRRYLRKHPTTQDWLEFLETHAP